mgnify:CR=1 FL=1
MRLYPELSYKLKLGGLEYSGAERDLYTTRFSFSSEIRFSFITGSDTLPFMSETDKIKVVVSKNNQ